MFLLPPFVLSILISTALAALFNLWQGGSARDLALYLIAGWLGFALGQLAGDWLGLNLLMIGQVHVAEASLTCGLLLFLARWLKT
ncbi:MAG: hypothetical protein ACOYZ7_08540 [Chloroflexota bacterium]